METMNSWSMTGCCPIILVLLLLKSKLISDFSLLALALLNEIYRGKIVYSVVACCQHLTSHLMKDSPEQKAELL